MTRCGYLIRAAEKEDLEAIYTVETLSFTNPYPSWYLSILLALAGDTFIVSEGDTGVDGYAAAVPLQGEVCHLASIAVAPPCRRRHVASALLASIEHLCVEKGKRIIVLEVEATNYAAQKLYVQHGYRYAGLVLNYYGEGRHALLMFKSISLAAAASNSTLGPHSGRGTA